MDERDALVADPPYSESEWREATIADLKAENEQLRHILSPLTGVLDALNEGMTPSPSMTLRRHLVDRARAVLHD